MEDTGKIRHKNLQFRDFPGGPVANAGGPGAQVRSLFRELDPPCHN